MLAHLAVVAGGTISLDGSKIHATALVDSQSHVGTRRLYTRLSAGEVRRQLIAQKGYTAEELPCERTIATKLNALGYTLTKVAKSQPQKKSLRPTPSSPR